MQDRPIGSNHRISGGARKGGGSRPCAIARVVGIACAGIAVTLAWGASGAQAAEPHTVRTTGGELQGVERGGAVAFLGVPFAAPPVGELRWQPPQAPTPWSGVRVADHYGNDCMQARRPGAPDASRPVSEDCLYLNVWKPASPAQGRLPVIVWIHGGAFAVGSGSQPLYDGASFSSHHGVVIVTLNYRLGRFGFFAHPALAREGAGQAGNYALLDQIAALKWVRANIAAFGGDPHEITVAGQSAGGISVSYLMESPLARGLFDRAIIESGVFRSHPTTLEQAEAAGEAAARSWGLTNPDAAALRAVPAARILGKGPMAAGRAGPMIDGHVVPQDVIAAFEAGNVAHVPLLIGSNSYEAGFFPAMSRGLSQRLAAEWPQVTAVFDGYGTHQTAAIEGQLATDMLITGPTWQAAKAAARHGLPTYLYYFSYLRPSQRGRMPGPAHIDELYALFDKMALVEPHPDAGTRRIVDEIESRWAAFAASGEPEGTGQAGGSGPPWPALTPAAFRVLEFTNDGPVVRTDFASKRLALAGSLGGRAMRPPGGR